MDEQEIELETGKIYYLDYGNNTQIIGRYENSDTTNHHFFSLLHYWNGFERFQDQRAYCVKSGIENIRRATKAEKHSLIRFEIENNTI